MVTRRKKKNALIRFELGWKGFCSLLLFSFCVLLWMFLLGIWAGQTVLLPHAGNGTPSLFSSYAKALLQKKSSLSKSDQADAAPEPEVADTAEAGSGEENSYFVLQVASYQDENEVRDAVQKWQGKNYEAFYLSPDETDGARYQLFLGKFKNLTDANAAAEKLENDDRVRAYITLLPAFKIKD